MSARVSDTRAEAPIGVRHADRNGPLVTSRRRGGTRRQDRAEEGSSPDVQDSSPRRAGHRRVARGHDGWRLVLAHADPIASADDMGPMRNEVVGDRYPCDVNIAAKKLCRSRSTVLPDRAGGRARPAVASCLWMSGTAFGPSQPRTSPRWFGVSWTTTRLGRSRGPWRCCRGAWSIPRRWASSG